MVPSGLPRDEISELSSSQSEHRRYGGSMSHPRRWLVILASLFLAGVTQAAVIDATRRTTWTPGVPGGIPDRTTICATVTAPPYNAVGNGITNDAPAIQSAINACPPGQVVFIPAGTYRLNNQLQVS